MSVIETIDALRNGLMWIGLSALAVIAVGIVGTWLYRGVASAMRRPLSVARITAFLAVSAFCVIRVGAKFLMPPPSTGGTPVVPVMQFPATGGTPVVPVVVTSEEIAQGWRLESVTTNEAVSYAMPTNGVEYAPWSLGGGYETHFPLDLGDFVFPFGTGVVRRLDVLSGGMVESLPRQRAGSPLSQYSSAMSICAAREWASIVPGVGRFWWADAARSASGPYQAKLLTWENVYAGRDRTGQYNAQIEFHDDGNFITRSNNVERVYRRVLPFDIDNDGLENSVDPDPLVAGPDAHGTNAEWYNTVCSNVLEAVASGSTGTTGILPVGNGGTGATGILPVDDDCVLSWRADVNSNAYYFVDVVTERGPLPIYFTGDRDSRLGNPVIVALAGVTNRVPLLIGVDYAVTSDTPFTVSFPIDYVHPTVTTNGVADYNVRWPLNFVFTESLTESNRVYTVTVEPYDPGGVLTWEGGGMRSGASSGCGCGCLSCMGYSASFSCSSICTCHGECKAVGRYAFETALFAVTGGECRCGFDDPPPDSPPSPHEPNDPPSLTITFSKPAVIFEDSFLEKPGVTMPRRSTRVRLTIDAYGGSGGGTFSVTGVKMSKLFAIGGNVVLPYGDELPPGGSYHATGVYEGAEGSDELNDVEVQGSLVPRYYPYNTSTSTATLTSVKVALTAEFIARDNPCQTRHTYGVGERVHFDATPALSAVEYRVVKSDKGNSSVYETFENEFTVDASVRRTYTCPMVSLSPDVTVSLAGCQYQPNLNIVEPSHVFTQSAKFDGVCWPVGECGEAGLQTVNYIAPFHVSFEGIAVSEIPCYEAIPPTGYFTNLTTHLTHGIYEDAGTAFWIKTNNYWTVDNAFTTSFIPNWSHGTLYWKIPIGWHRKDPTANKLQSILNPDYEENGNANTRPLLIGGRTDAYLQRRTIQEDGTFITEKFGFWISRTRWCHIKLGRYGEEGETIQWFHHSQ